MLPKHPKGLTNIENLLYKSELVLRWLEGVPGSPGKSEPEGRPGGPGDVKTASGSPPGFQFLKGFEGLSRPCKGLLKVL